MPRSVRVGCYEFKVEVSEMADSIAGSEFGHMNIINQKIRVSPNLSNAKLANVFLHECLHAVHWVFGLSDDSSEEEFTTLGANGLCVFMQENPRVMSWLTEMLKL
jgi:hypothetical protein